MNCSYKEYGFRLYEKSGPRAFLTLMSNAKECFVESFHGMLFAYMFKRDFWLLDTHDNYDEIENEIFSNNEREVPTSQIGELVMQKLKAVDQVAYVRFASVYREFKDINTFVDEIGKLLKSQESK
jgi:transcriptional regulator NrdR family protein